MGRVRTKTPTFAGVFSTVEDRKFLFFNLIRYKMYVVYILMHNIHVIFDIANGFYDEYDVCMKMLLT